MIHPARTYEELTEKLERLLDDEASKPWEEAYDRLELGQALSEYYNPLLIEEIAAYFRGCDLAGYNIINFDIPLLAEEMLRAGIDFDMKNRVSVDVQTIFHKMEQRNLAAAYRFYCNKSLEDAHSAEADAIAPIVYKESSKLDVAGVQSR